eukprot:scaffold1588_cov222-Amphora_coffeaeformis.AAC.10
MVLSTRRRAASNQACRWAKLFTERGSNAWEDLRCDNNPTDAANSGSVSIRHCQHAAISRRKRSLADGGGDDDDGLMLLPFRICVIVAVVMMIHHDLCCAR